MVNCLNLFVAASDLASQDLAWRELMEYVAAVAIG